MSQNKQRELRLAIDIDQYEAHFANGIQIDTSYDSVVLHFIQKLPGELDLEEAPNGKLISSIVLSWPHFARITRLLNRVLDENRGRAKDAFDTNVLKGE